MLSTLLKSIGLPLTIKSYMVDYIDAAGTSRHRPLQSVLTPGAEETDAQVIAYIKGELEAKGYKVSAITEAIGDFDVEDLERIFSDPELTKKYARLLYLDPLAAFGTLAAGE